MSQYFAESTQGEGTGSNNKDSLVTGSVNQLINTFSSMNLEILVHPIDASLTWMQGVVSGLQDVIQTIDRNRSVLLPEIGFGCHVEHAEGIVVEIE